MALFSEVFLSYYNKLPRGESSRNMLFLPIWGWEILAPINQPPKKLNLFQHTILGLFDTGQTDPEKIAGWLGTEVDLVHLIIANELQPNGWLDNYGKLTKDGKNILDGALEQRGEMRRCFILQDAITGKVWPRILLDLNYLDTEHIEDKVLIATDKDSGKKLEPFIMRPARYEEPIPPKTHQIRQAIQKHRDAWFSQNLRQQDYQSGANIKLDDFELIDQSSQPFFILSHLIQSPIPTHVCALQDPTHTAQVDEWIQHLPTALATQNKAFEQKVQRFTGEQIKAGETLQEFEERIAGESAFKLAVDFPFADRVAQLAPYLIAIQRRSKQLSESSHPQNSDAEDLINQCQKALEACFKHMLKKWPLPHAEIIEKDFKHDDMRRALQRRAGHYFRSDSLDLFCKTPARTVFSAIGYSTGRWAQADVSLGPLVVAALLSVSDHPQHPLIYRTSEGQDLDQDLHCLFGLMQDRNSSAHASGMNAPIKEFSQTAQDHAVFVQRWVQFFTQQLG
jgi:hypothetical protein